MGWFASKKENSPLDEASAVLQQRIFPGGDRERLARGMAVSAMCAHKLDFKEAAYLYSKIKGHFELAVILFDGETKKGITAEQLIQIAMRDSQGKLTGLEAVAIVLYAAFGCAEGGLSGFDKLKLALASMFGSDDQGYDADILPFGLGEFGLEATNPVPVRGIGGSRIYLARLRSLDGKPITTKRLRSLKVVDANTLVDEYEASDQHNRVLCKLYICPYHQRVSRKAPNGFILATKQNP
jgi:hypothetical protein